MTNGGDGGLLDRAPDDRVQMLTPDGELTGPDAAHAPDLTDEELVAIYRDMRLARRFDERALSLQRQGRMGTYAALAGQEGAQVGSTHALRDDDWIVYQYREHAAVLCRDPDLTADYLRYWMGDEAGNAAIADAHIFPLNITIADQIPHAVGMAWAAKKKGDDNVVACHFGDGATSEGDFHEGLNFAGVFDTPTVFFCNNNQWAISIPRERQTASDTLAQKAHAYGFDGVQVDGMDPLAVYAVTKAAAEKARNPAEGEVRPTLIEAIQYRYGAHTTADDPTMYREQAEVEAWREKDPIDRFEAYLVDSGRLDEDQIDAVETAIEAILTDAIERAEAVEIDPSVMFEHAYAEPTPAIEEQRAYFERLRERHGDDALREE